MISDIEKLHTISQKKIRRIIGLMSGTSLDGLDIAVCSIKNAGIQTRIKVDEFTTVEYSSEQRQKIQQVFSRKDASIETLCLLNEWIGQLHGEMINSSLKKWDIHADDIDLIASHGQTVYHAPSHQHQNAINGNGTLQIGDADHIAISTGIITIADFRQKHIAAGGEGAPLAAYGDLLIFADEKKDTILLNIGGIANLTYLPSASSEKKMFSTDLGPGNTMMDAWMRKNFNKNFDEGGTVAQRGMTDQNLLHALLAHSFFELPFPKTTGPELFNLQYLDDNISNTKNNLSAEDIMSTLAAFTSTVIIDGIKSMMQDTAYNLYISGGGMHNPVVVEDIIKELSTAEMRSTKEKGIDPDAKEAVLFALLANECVAGSPATFLKHFPNTSMGKISLPG